MKILIAEDERITRRSLERQLEQWGHEVSAAVDGAEAWKVYQGGSFDAVVTDWEMPGLSGFELIERIREGTTDRYVYVIILTSRSEVEDVVAGLDAGADDFLRKPFDRGELRARLNAGQRLVTLERALAHRNQQMARDLAAGANYVRSMIPPAVSEGSPKIDWRYVPATDLAGDSLGYHWIGENHMAMYVLDVTGHGLDAALLSVTILNVVRSMSLPETDFTRPDQVLSMLNDKFPMEEHEDRCFTMWYGVFDKISAALTWSGGGHPEALLFNGEAQPQRLGSTGPMMGMLPGSEFPANQIDVHQHDRLFIYTDGAFEIDRRDGSQWTLAEFVDYLSNHQSDPHALDRLWGHVRDLGGTEELDDDFTVIVIDF